MAKHSNLTRAGIAKQDEFYTQLSDIENELCRYWEQLHGKVILCNCDDPYESNFFKYFAMNFNFLGLKKLIATCYAGSPVQGQQLILAGVDGLTKCADDDKDGKHPYKVEITEVVDANEDGAIDLFDVEYLLKNGKNVLTLLDGDGDFRSAECIELLEQADVVVTNPPFSLFREYIAQLMEYDKKFLIIGSLNAITYKECFRFIKGNRMWLGYNNGSKTYLVPNDYEQENTFVGVDGKKYATMGNTGWFTNLDTTKRQEPLTLYKKYSPSEYPHYDNYDAIEVPKTADIPNDYDGVIGVPITFLDKHDPNQFEIIGCNRGVDQDPNGIYGRGSFLNGKETFKRLFIRIKDNGNEN